MSINLMNSLSMQQLHQQMLYQQHQMALHHYQQEEISNTNGWPSMLSSPMAMGPPLTENVKIELENKKLWQKFHMESTEMIITKSGRRMFPSVKLSVSGLEARTSYCVLMELELASDRRHKYVGGVTETTSPGSGGSRANVVGSRGWTSAGPAEPQPSIERRLYLHPDSPACGSHWMQQPLNFSKLKLTNNVVEHHSNVLLTSMHKYIPRIWIVRCDDITNVRDLVQNPASSFKFTETEFIAVTAYQNENITKLKIDHNPFAKGFRESGQSACKRKRLRLDGTSSSTSEISSHDEEEGNASSSDSDHNDCPPSKRARLHHREADENCSISSSDNEPAPRLREEVAPVPEPRREVQPRLHRPWTDDTEEPTVPTRLATPETLQPHSVLQRMPPQQYPVNLGVQQAHYHWMALELAKMSQIRDRYLAASQAQHLSVLMDYRR